MRRLVDDFGIFDGGLLCCSPSDGKLPAAFQWPTLDDKDVFLLGRELAAVFHRLISDDENVLLLLGREPTADFHRLV